MTVYHDILRVLRDADEPLSGAEVYNRIDNGSVRRSSVYSKLKKMSEKGKVFRDENYEDGYSVMYQLRQDKRLVI